LCLGESDLRVDRTAWNSGRRPQSVLAPTRAGAATSPRADLVQRIGERAMSQSRRGAPAACWLTRSPDTSRPARDARGGAIDSFSGRLRRGTVWRSAVARQGDLMAKRGKVIISCAVTGSIHVPSQTPYLPITPEEIAEAAIGAGNAGAAVVHLHARDPRTGQPSPDPELFARFLPTIKARSDVVINITTGGGHGMTLEQRTRAARTFRPELCSLNMGSMNFGLFPARERIKEFKHAWEPAYLEMTRDFIFRNTFKDIETIVTEFAAQGTRFEFECYDVGHLYNLAYFLETGVVEPPLFVQMIFGILGGIGPEAENLMHMKAIADRLFGDDYYWSVLGAGRHQTNLVTIGAILGGNVRVGLEDSIHLEKGALAESNADQVAKIARILRELSLEVATPSEARAMLALKGADRTAIPDAVPA